MVDMLIRLQELAHKETGYRRSPKAKTGTPFHVPIVAELRTATSGQGLRRQADGRGIPISSILELV